LPWIAPMMRGFFNALRGSGESQSGDIARISPGKRFAIERFLAVWAAAIFIFYAPSGSKLAPYILPMLPPLALLAARYLAARPLSVPALRATLCIAAAMALLFISLPWLAARISASAERRLGYDNMAQLGLLAGLLLMLAVALSLLLDRKRARPAAIATLATGWMASLALFTQGTDELQRWKGGALLAADLAPLMKNDTQFFCLDNYPQSVIFLLARTCTVVGDYGELETQFDDGERNWLPDDASFTAAWSAAPRAVAIVNTDSISRWQPLATGATIAVNKPYGVVLVK
jgi:4-amino-4-deoxy-L-arabinose transferase-like glycosyltransferase